VPEPSKARQLEEGVMTPKVEVEPIDGLPGEPQSTVRYQSALKAV